MNRDIVEKHSHEYLSSRVIHVFVFFCFLSPHRTTHSSLPAHPNNTTVHRPQENKIAMTNPTSGLINHISLSCSDLAKSRKFYDFLLGELLGYQTVMDQPYCVMYAKGGACMFLPFFFFCW